jgi:uncharacterized tellurite resistance protein B-like protein
VSILKLLRLRRDEPAAVGDTETVREIVARLEALPPERARRLAAFAYVLARVAHADLKISAAETRRMEEILQRVGHLPEDLAVLAVEIAKRQSQLFGGTENFLVTREFKEITEPHERQELLDCLFAVAAADDAISGAEDGQLRLIAGELGFSHAEFVATRAAWSDKRDVLRGLPSDRPPV